MNEYIYMNEWIYSTDNFSNQSSHTEKWPPKTGIHVPSDFRHFAYKHIASTWRNNHWFVRGKHRFIWIIWHQHSQQLYFWSIDRVCLRCMYIGCVANSNWKLWTTGNVACVPIDAFALHSNTLFFLGAVSHEIWRIFPRSFDIVVIPDIPTRYLIFCTKQMRKQSLLYWQHPEHHVTFPECLHFPGRMACLCSETSKGVL